MDVAATNGQYPQPLWNNPAFQNWKIVKILFSASSVLFSKERKFDTVPNINWNFGLFLFSHYWWLFIQVYLTGAVVKLIISGTRNFNRLDWPEVCLRYLTSTHFLKRILRPSYKFYSGISLNIFYLARCVSETTQVDIKPDRKLKIVQFHSPFHFWGWFII